MAGWRAGGLAHYESRVEDPVAFALANRVLLLRSAGGIGIAIALGGLQFEEDAVDRAKAVELEPGASLRICPAEDLIIMKAFAARPAGPAWHSGKTRPG